MVSVVVGRSGRFLNQQCGHRLQCHGRRVALIELDLRPVDETEAHTV
jgi:hypothetical protein